MKNIRFCDNCGFALDTKLKEGIDRPYCKQCDSIIFVDPKVAVLSVSSIQNKIVLVKRSNQPYQGNWSFPAGFVDRGENVKDATVREFREETGLDAQVDQLLGVYSEKNDPIVLIAYSLSVTGGTLKAGFDASEVTLFKIVDLPDLPFKHDYEILRAWLDYKDLPSLLN